MQYTSLSKPNLSLKLQFPVNLCDPVTYIQVKYMDEELIVYESLFDVWPILLPIRASTATITKWYISNPLSNLPIHACSTKKKLTILVISFQSRYCKTI